MARQVDAGVATAKVGVTVGVAVGGTVTTGVTGLGVGGIGVGGGTVNCALQTRPGGTGIHGTLGIVSF